MVGAVWPASGAPVVVGGTSCPFGSEGEWIWLVEIPHAGRAATLSRDAVAAGGGEGQEANCGNVTPWL